MNITKTLAMLLAAGAISAPAWSAVYVYQDVPQAPPKPAEESMPTAREGYVWAPGYWDWRESKYAWSKGHWVKARPGYRYVAPRWEENQGRWNLYSENWVKDEDAKDKRAKDDAAEHR